MDNNLYEPSFEVVDKAEDAEDYLLAKNRRTTESTLPTQTVDTTINNNISTNNDTVTQDEDKMNFNGLSFMASTSGSEAKDVEKENVNVAPEDQDTGIVKCVSEDEEGQEALWLEEAETSPSASSANASPTVNKSSSRRSSFLFGSGAGGASKKTATISPKRAISFRKKKNPPKVMLLDRLSNVKSNTPAVVPNVSSESVAVATSKDVVAVTGAVVSQPDAVIASDTISSLGFDKSFDVKSPLSMSSLNEILDAPLTPTATTEESVAEPKQKRTKKNAARGLFRKKEKKDKLTNSFSFMNRSRYARSVVVVEKEMKEDDDDADDADPVLFVTRDINERIQASLMRAIENDDAESLTSFTGVPMILKEDKNTKSNEKPKSLTVLQGQRPMNFEKVKPTFVVSKDSLTLAEIQEKFVPMFDDDDDDDEEEDNNENVQNLSSPSTLGENVEVLKSASPNSTGADSAVTDRYDVAQNMDDDNESDCDDGKSDKYSVLPDPCSFCDSFWVSTDNQAAVSKTMSESPDMKADPNKFDAERALDSPVIDKYAELPVPEVVVTTNDDDITEEESNFVKESTFNKSTTVVTSNRTFSGVFNRFKRPSSSSEMPERMATSSCVEPVPSEPQGQFTSESVSDSQKLDTEETMDSVVVASKSTTSTIFGKFKKPSASKSVEPVSSEPQAQFTSESTSDAPQLDTDEPMDSVVIASKSTTSTFFGKFKKSSAAKSKSNDVVSDPAISTVESSMNVPMLQEMNKNVSTVESSTKSVPRKSILKKRKEVMMIPVEEPASYIVPGNDLESPGAKISVLSLGSEPYVIPAAATSATVTSKTTVSMLEQHPVEDPSTEGSSSADDEVAHSKIISIAPVSPTKSTTNGDPLLTRLRKNIHKRRGLEPQTDVDPIIAVGIGRTRLDP